MTQHACALRHWSSGQLLALMDNRTPILRQEPTAAWCPWSGSSSMFLWLHLVCHLAESPACGVRSNCVFRLQHLHGYPAHYRQAASAKGTPAGSWEPAFIKSTAPSACGRCICCTCCTCCYSIVLVCVCSPAAAYGVLGRALSGMGLSVLCFAGACAGWRYEVSACALALFEAPMMA